MIDRLTAKRGRALSDPVCPKRGSHTIPQTTAIRPTEAF